MLRAILSYSLVYGAIFLPVVLSLLFALVFAVGWLSSYFWAVGLLEKSTVDISFLGLLLSVIGMIVVGSNSRTFEFAGTMSTFTFNPSTVFLLPGMMILVFLGWINAVVTPYSLGFILACCAGALCFWYAWAFAIFFLSRKARRYSLFDNTLVRRMIEERLSIPSSRWRSAQILATVARERRFYDPAVKFDEDSERWKLRVGETDQPGKLVTRWVAEYIDLLAAPYQEQVATLLDTSAIPIAFPIRKSPQGFWTTDGGIADNLPIAAAVNIGECDMVIVVSLNKGEMANAVDIQEHIDSKWAASVIPTMKADEKHALLKKAEEGDGQWMPLVPGRRQASSVQIITIEPSVALCTIDLPFFRFFTGTLNFDPAEIDRWIDQGYADCKRQFQ